MRVYKKYIDFCIECPHYVHSWCNERNVKLSHELAKIEIARGCRLDRSERSKKQNSYYWGVMVTILSDEWGYTKDEVHDILKAKFLCEKQIGKPDKIKSTTKLDTKEMVDYQDQIKIWAASEWGIYIPDPNEEIK